MAQTPTRVTLTSQPHQAAFPVIIADGGDVFPTTDEMNAAILAGQQQYHHPSCKYQLLESAIAAFDPAATSAADWNGAVAGAAWTADVAEHARVVNQATGIIYTLTTATTCTATGETALHGAELRVTDSAGRPVWHDTAVTGATPVFVPSDSATPTQVSALMSMVAALLQSSGYGKFVSIEEQHAKSIPVSGALVVAPLAKTLTNYGSLGGAITSTGTPTLGNYGYVTDGSTVYGYIVTGYQASFTCTFRIRGDGTGYQMVTVDSAAIGAAGWKGWAVNASSATVWRIGSVGVSNTDTAVSYDDLWHTVTIKRDASDSNRVTLYIDGTSVATATDGNANGTTLLIGATENASSAIQYQTKVGIKNLAMYGSALSDANRALVEAWSASDVTDSVPVVDTPNSPIIKHTDAAWLSTQVNEPCVMIDPSNPNQLLMFFSANGASGWCIGRATAPVTDPTNWTQYASNPIYTSSPLHHRLDSVVYDAGTYYFYLTDYVTNQVDLYTSTDGGFTLTRHASSPVLTATGQGRNDGTAVNQMAVLKEGSDWHAWYSIRGASDLQEIRYAHSTDGLTWTKNAAGSCTAVKRETPWSSYFEWHSVRKVESNYVITSECYDGRYWTACQFYCATPGDTFTPARKNPIIKRYDQGYHVATPAIYTVRGQTYALYQRAINAVDYSAQNWDLCVALVCGTEADLIA